MTPSKRQTRVAWVLTLGLGAMLAALAGRLVFIYATSSDRLAERAARQHYMRVPIRPIRGSLLDTRLRILAGSVECRSVFADPHVIKDPSKAAVKVGPILGLGRDEVFRRITADRDSRFVWLARRVRPETAKAVRELGIYGIGLATEGRRRYPNGSLAAHVVGFVGIDEQGLEGLEKLYDKRLAGSEGEAFILADRRRRPIWSRPDQFVPAEDGQHLVLTLDAAIQAFAEEALAEAVETFEAESGAAVVMDPKTGAVLAMANVPTFHPARFADYPRHARRNRAITDPHPPGSTAKPYIAAKALDGGLVRLGETFYCEDGFWAERRLRDAGHAYGELTFEMIVIKSSNIGMAKLGVLMGNERLYAALHDFGFGSRTGLRMPGESTGKVYPLGRWTKYSTTRVPFGQEFSATPLQLATAFCAFANGGKLLRPKVVRCVMDTRGEIVLDLSGPEVVRLAMRPETARTMRHRVLRQVVEIGTGKNCRIPGYGVFGKTGTAQGVDPETGAVSHTRYIASFVAGAPVDDPRLVVLVSVNEPKKELGFYGGTVAAPAVRKILEQALEYLGVPRRDEDGEPVPVPTYLVRREVDL